jgi:hypothetical protein
MITTKIQIKILRNLKILIIINSRLLQNLILVLEVKLKKIKRSMKIQIIILTNSKIHQ